MISISYDDITDVLYIAMGTPVPSTCEENSRGLLLRYAVSDRKPSGVTVVDFFARWTKNQDILIKEIANFLNANTEQIETAINKIDA